MVEGEGGGRGFVGKLESGVLTPDASSDTL